MAKYTETLKESIWIEDFIPEEVDIEEIVGFINSDSFRTFNEGLVSIINDKYPEEKGKAPIEVVKEKCKQNEVDISEIGAVNTLKNWFRVGSSRPKKGTEDRRKMFVLAFALGFNIEETKNLFTNVFLDRAIDYRDYRELIYYHCIKNSFSYETARNLISQVSFSNADIVDSTIYTSIIAKAVNDADSQTLIDYINTHPYNFGIRNVTAKLELQRLLEEAKLDVIKESGCRFIYENEKLQKKSKAIASKTVDKVTINEMYEYITDQEMDKTKGTSSMFKNAILPKEIKLGFPEASLFSKKEPSAYEMRKMLIFLFSYSFWCRMEYSEFTEEESIENIGYDDYVDQLDMLLLQAGLPAIYPGDPHDWLYCYCTISETPLCIFREMLSITRTSEFN